MGNVHNLDALQKVKQSVNEVIVWSEMNDQWMNIKYDEVMLNATNKDKSIEAESNSKEVIEQIIDKVVSNSDNCGNMLI